MIYHELYLIWLYGIHIGEWCNHYLFQLDFQYFVFYPINFWLCSTHCLCHQFIYPLYFNFNITQYLLLRIIDFKFLHISITGFSPSTSCIIPLLIVIYNYRNIPLIIFHNGECSGLKYSQSISYSFFFVIISNN